MSGRLIHKFLDRPNLYNLTINMLALGFEKVFVDRIRSLRAQFPDANPHLDIGCGPQSWLWHAGEHPIGLDLTYSYCQAYRHQGEPTVAGSAARLPFPAASFGAVWSIGMFHHLPDSLAIQAMAEMIRVCKTGGWLVIFDAVLPRSAWQRPLAYLLRRADRGRFVRPQAGFEALLPQRPRWTVERVTFSYTGLEIAICTYMKSA